jgi:ferredoxin/flavodoxin---NADP+ reductase
MRQGEPTRAPTLGRRTAGRRPGYHRRVESLTAPDGRVIAPESPHYNARLTKRVDLTDELGFFWVAPEGDALDFEPGQYFTIGVDVGGKLVMRPYSVASSPREKDSGYELYVRIVPEGIFTPLLWVLPEGHPMHIRGPKGRFLLEPDDQRTHVFVCSGTGIAPFISMMRTLRMDGTPRPTIVLHGASYVDDLGYRDEVEGHQRAGTYPCRYIPTISRPNAPENAGWAERTGRVEMIIGDVLDELGLTPDNSIAYLCGNPDMIENADALLTARGFPEPQIKKELYWPKGKEPMRATAGATVVAATPE